MPKRITAENVFIEQPYRSIINLLMEYQESGGLTFEQIRLALVHKHSIQRINGDFGNEVRRLALEEKIIPNRITSPNNLCKFLRSLSSEELEVITKYKKSSRSKKFHYQLNQDAYKIGLRIQNKEALSFESFNNNQILGFSWPVNFKILKIKNIVEFVYTIKPQIILYGFSDKLFDLLTEEEQEKIEEKISEAADLILEINMMKMEARRRFEEKHKDLRKDFENDIAFSFYISRKSLENPLLLSDDVHANKGRTISVSHRMIRD